MQAGYFLRIMGAANPWQQAAEEQYVFYLQRERHLFAWCLVEYDGMSRDSAVREAQIFYRYEAVDDARRGQLFHDSAWHWAMLHVVGEQYWKRRPELAHESERFREEADSFSVRQTA